MSMYAFYSFSPISPLLLSFSLPISPTLLCSTFSNRTPPLLVLNFIFNHFYSGFLSHPLFFSLLLTPFHSPLYSLSLFLLSLLFIYSFPSSFSPKIISTIFLQSSSALSLSHLIHTCSYVSLSDPHILHNFFLSFIQYLSAFILFSNLKHVTSCYLFFTHHFFKYSGIPSFLIHLYH